MVEYAGFLKQEFAPPPQFAGSVRNGVTSHDFGRYGSAYRLALI